MQKKVIKSLEELERFCLGFLDDLKIVDQRNFASQNSAQVIKLSGDLGSGKTTFVQNIAKSLGIKEKVSSPTFSISKIYKIPKNSFTEKKILIHIDAYRLGEQNSIKNIGLDRQLEDSKNLIFIEWPEIIEPELSLLIQKKDTLPNQTKNINFTHISEGKREISY